MKKSSIKKHKNKKNNNINKLFLIIVFCVLFILFFITNNSNSCFKNKSNIDNIVKNPMNNKFQNEMMTIKEIGVATKIPVFTFHRIVPDNVKHEIFESDEWTASVDVFKKQIKYLYDNGYKTISMDQFYCWYEKKCEFPKKTVMLTFDDGNADDYFTVMPIIKKYNFKATTFIVGARTLDIDENPYDENVRTFITKELMTKTKNIYPNWEYQSHSFDLHVVESNGKEKVLNLTEDEIAEDFENNSVFGFKYMAYPFGVYNEKIIKVLEKYNYRLAFTFRVHEYATRESKRYEIPRIKINGFSNVEEIKKWLDY